jgi:3D (Asp-Asp-Asp) domain-containing protein
VGIWGFLFFTKMEALKQNRKRIISLKNAKKLILSLILVFVFEMFLFPMPTLANEAMEISEIERVLSETVLQEVNDLQPMILNHLPENGAWEAESTTNRTITAYNSEVGQCDDSPCITANGFNVCEHGIEDTIAANFLKFGTKVRIPELFGDRVFIVRDRMNGRFSDRVDVWMVNKQDARNFGVKFAKIEVLP